MSDIEEVSPPQEEAGGGDDSGDASVATPVATKPSKHPQILLPIYVLTGIFGAIFILAPFLFRKNPNKEIIRVSIMIAAFSMWLFWVTVYISQMNPLLGPRLHNSTLAWIAHSWGKPASPSTDD